MTTGTRRANDFCWINMLTPRPAEARAFFTALLGWTYREIPGLGHMILVDGRDIGGLFDLEGPNTPPGTPPLIGVMVKVASADATCEKVRALGGRAKPAFDIRDQGRMAECFDPSGAEFDLWQPMKSQGTDADTGHRGAPSWFEALTTDVNRGAAFYAELFGWTPEAMPLPGMRYTTFKQGDAYVAGMMAITPDMGPMPPHWSTYFTVTDVDATARQAAELGAEVCVPVRDVPGVGRFCGIRSPQGVTFYVITYARSG
jgi:predicted enzyme related to lactoylglutathione lyase